MLSRKAVSSGTSYGDYVRNNDCKIQPYQLMAFQLRKFIPGGIFLWYLGEPFSCFDEQNYPVFSIKLYITEDVASQ